MTLVLAMGLSMPAFSGDVDRFISAYKAEARKLKSLEDNKARSKQGAINKAQTQADQLANAVSAYQASLTRYEDNYITPTKKAIDSKKTEVTNLRQKIKDYEAGLNKAVSDKRFGRRGMFGAIGGSAYGAADYQDLIEDAKESLGEAEKKQGELEASLKSYEQQKGEYEKTITAKQEDVKKAQTGLQEAQGELKKQKVASAELLTNSIGGSIDNAVGQMIQRGRYASLEAGMLLRDLDNLATKLGVDKTELQHVFAANPELREKIGNTAIGGYVNSQIANAMGSVCEYQNMCAAKGAEGVNSISPEIVKKSLGHLYDKNRGKKVVDAIGEKEGRDVAAESAESKDK